MYDTILFDLDGTLLNTLDDLRDGVNYVMEHFGYPKHSLSAIRRFVGNGIRNLMIKATPKGEENPFFEEGFAMFTAYYNEHCRVKTGPYPGIMELLEALNRQDIKMAIVSNKNQAAVEELSSYYFKNLISVSVGDGEGRKRKPAPDAVNHALQQLGATKEHALYVGDSDVDAATAANAGLDCVLVSWGFRDRTLLETLPNVGIIDQPEELLTFLP